MDSERARPLAALVLVAMLCALIVTLGMQRNRQVGPLASGAPPATPQVVDTRVVLGSTLSAKPSRPAKPAKQAQLGGPSLLTAVAPLASSASSSASSVAERVRARDHRAAHRDPVGRGNSTPSTQDHGTTSGDSPTPSTPSTPPDSSGSSSIAARVVPRDDPTSELPSSSDGAVTAFDFADAAQAWQDALGVMLGASGGEVEDPGPLPVVPPDADGGAGR